MTEKEFKNIYNKFLNNLIINDKHIEGIGIKLSTISKRNNFYLYRDNNNKIYTLRESKSDEKPKERKFNLIKRQYFQNNLASQSKAYIEPIVDYVIKYVNKYKLFFKNIILYGPPGVGKTHNYQNLISMIEEGSKTELEIFDIIKNNDKNIELNQEIFNKIKNENRVEFVTFHQSYSYEDFIEGFRPHEDRNIKLEDGIFKNIISTIIKNKFKIFKELIFKNNLNDYRINVNLLSYEKEVINYKDIEYLCYVVKDNIVHVTYKYNSYNKEKNLSGFNVSLKDIETVYKKEYNIINYKNIKKILYNGKNKISEEENKYIIDLLNIILVIENKYEFKKLQKNYYLVIDEINRGNISKIFGELITLIEEDKRDIYEVTLPYSKESFKIPSNLYIIATMNSSDKSIATIDIALRRRFTFLNMLPNSTLVKDEKAKELMEQLNTYIKDKIGIDYMLGHSYFMKVQSEDDLKFVIEYKIKPLLEEYFYADEKTADEIIKEAKEYKKKENSIE